MGVLHLNCAGSGGAGGAYPGGGGSADAKLLDAYNSAARKKTLLEQHAEAQEAAKAPKPAKKKAKVEGPSVAGPSVAGPSGVAVDDDKAWVGKHPWRPFDRCGTCTHASIICWLCEMTGCASYFLMFLAASMHATAPTPMPASPLHLLANRRDKDLEIKPKALDPSKILAAQQGALGNKFQSAGGTRHFL